MDWQFGLENSCSTFIDQDGEFKSSAFLTLETLSSTSKGRMSPMTTTILLAKSTLYEVTPVRFLGDQEEKRSVIKFMSFEQNQHGRFFTNIQRN